MKTTANTETKVIAGDFLGLAEDIPNQIYHSSPGLSSSGLTKLALSPAHYQAYKTERDAPTAAMQLGTAIHSLVLEGGKGILKAPGSTRATNLYKDFAKANPDAILLLDDEYERASRAAESVLSHPTAKKLLQKGKAEQSAFWRDADTQVLCKCRPDYLRDDGIVIDLKSTSDASPAEFQRSISSRKYHWQSAWYLRGLSLVLDKPVTEFVHLVVETHAPYGVAIYALDEQALEKGREDIKILLQKYAESLHSDQWASYSTEIQNMSLKPWDLI